MTMLGTRTLAEFDAKLASLNKTHDVPDDWEPDCDNCRWFLDHYERSDLYMFESMWGGLHVNNRYRTKEKGTG